jgi:hypothetical protein
VTEWTTSTDPKAMVAFGVDQKLVSERKLRLFACACFRRVWHLLPEKEASTAVEVTERYADSPSGDDEREHGPQSTAAVRSLGAQATRWCVVAVARTAARRRGRRHCVKPARSGIRSRALGGGNRAQRDLVRDIVSPLARPSKADG